MTNDARKKNKANDNRYRKQFKELSRYHDFTFKPPKSGKLSPNQKRAITIQSEKQQHFRNYISQDKFGQQGTGYKFIKASHGQISKLKTLFPNQTTNKGAFIKTPKLRNNKVTEIRVTKSGEVEIKIGNRTQVVVAISARDYVSRKRQYLVDVLGNRPKPDAISLQVNGFTSNLARDADTFIRDIGEGYLSRLFEHFRNEADKYKAKAEAEITGVVLTYFGSKRKRKMMTRNYIQSQFKKSDFRKDETEDSQNPF